jgi:hypothetical protein
MKRGQSSGRSGTDDVIAVSRKNLNKILQRFSM